MTINHHSPCNTSFLGLLRWGILLAAALPTLGFGEQRDGFAAYIQAIPGSEESIELLPIPGGQFTMGSPATEAGRQGWEGPQHPVTVDDFWMARYELSWQQYELLVYRSDSFDQLTDAATLQRLAIDGVTGATAPYAEMSFGMGKEGYPTVNVTQYAALRYARWLSAKTGHFYRLPTEAEWEYACRAGTSSAWSFGDDPGALEAHGVFRDNSDKRYAKLGSKTANPWGLFDMHGNVSEWTVDAFDTDFYSEKNADNPWNPPSELYPRVVRGGSWIDPAEATRCAARHGSNANWKERDPQIPKSLWWLTNAPFVGIRLVRPRVPPSPTEVAKYWPEPIEDYGL